LFQDEFAGLQFKENTKEELDGFMKYSGEDTSKIENGRNENEKV
jgi:hypothetical protein